MHRACVRTALINKVSGEISPKVAADRPRAVADRPPGLLRIAPQDRAVHRAGLPGHRSLASAHDLRCSRRRFGLRDGSGCGAAAPFSAGAVRPVSDGDNGAVLPEGSGGDFGGRFRAELEVLAGGHARRGSQRNQRAAASMPATPHAAMIPTSPHG